VGAITLAQFCLILMPDVNIGPGPQSALGRQIPEERFFNVEYSGLKFETHHH
jgi:hypothetical protein